jgi:hypothetical protein
MSQKDSQNSTEIVPLRERVWIKIREETWNTILSLIGKDHQGQAPAVSSFDNQEWLLFHRLIEAKCDPKDGQYYLIVAYDRFHDTKFSSNDSERLDRLEGRRLEKELEHIPPLLTAEFDPERGPVLVKHRPHSSQTSSQVSQSPAEEVLGSQSSQQEPVNF